MYGESRLFGAVEAGGTKFVCAIGDESGTIHSELRFPTADPVSTLAKVRDFLKDIRGGSAPRAIGVATLAPPILHPRSAKDVFIAKTPQPRPRARQLSRPAPRG